jgi:hypothetical protein
MRALATMILIGAALTACPAPFPSNTVKDGDGQAWRVIECRHKVECLRRAEALCKHGYVDRDNLQNPHEMMIRCKVIEWQ